jgi:hypothetical protein
MLLLFFAGSGTGGVPPVVIPDVPGRVTLRLGGKNPRV